MDYKELIERLKKQGSITTCKTRTICNDCSDAATAIETLLAEREAAVEYIPKNCNTCRYWYDGGCVAPLELFGGCDFGVRQAWQWRGPTPPDRERTEG